MKHLHDIAPTEKPWLLVHPRAARQWDEAGAITAADITLMMDDMRRAPVMPQYQTAFYEQMTQQRDPVRAELEAMRREVRRLEQEVYELRLDRLGRP